MSIPGSFASPKSWLPLRRLRIAGSKRFLDVLVQDDSGVDFVSLEVKTCTCREDLVVSTDADRCGAVVTFPPPPFTDCDPNLSVVCAPASGSVFHLGTTTVNCAAKDSAGRSARCAFDVVVADTTGPLVHCPANVTVECAGPAGSPATYSATAADNCEGVVPATCARARPIRKASSGLVAVWASATFS